jgi:hypothetical protein
MIEITNRTLAPDETLEMTGEIHLNGDGINLFRGGRLIIRDATVHFGKGQIYDPDSAETEMFFENVEFDGREAGENALVIGRGKTRIRRCRFHGFPKTVIRADVLGQYCGKIEADVLGGLVRGLLGMADLGADEASMQLVIEDVAFEDCAGGPFEAPMILGSMGMQMPAAVMLRECLFIRCRGSQAGAVFAFNFHEEHPLKVRFHDCYFEDCVREGWESPERLSRHIVTRGCTFQGCSYTDAITEQTMEKMKQFITEL